MSSFTTRLLVEVLDDGIDFRVHEPFTYHVGSLGSDVYVHVPVDFVTDFASTPQWIWWLLPPTGKYGKAAVIHDYLCQHHTLIASGKPITITRKQTDDIFLEAMAVLDVPKWKRVTMYTFVRGYAKVKGLH